MPKTTQFSDAINAALSAYQGLTGLTVKQIMKNDDTLGAFTGFVALGVVSA